MDSTLFINPIIGIDGREQTAENILLNRSRVIDWYDNANDETLFYYKVSENVKDKTLLIKSQYPILQFETIFNETTTNKFIVVNVNKINTKCRSHDDWGGLKTSDVISKLRINVNNIVWAKTRGDYSYIWIDRGYQYVLIETGDTLAELNLTVSASGSIN